MNKLLIEQKHNEDTNKQIKIGTSIIPECFNPVIRKYKRGEVIMQYSEKHDSIGFVVSGIAYLNSINTDGQNNIIEYYEENELFGKRLSPDNSFNCYYISAKNRCEIAFIPYEKLITCCEKRCEKHIKIIDYLINVSIKKSQTHIDILSQRTIRNKLLYYFRYLCEQNDMRHIILPLSLSDLADYLSVDRSAMMREIKKMNEEGLIKSSGKKILLLKNFI